MTATLDGVTKKKPEPTAEQAAALELVRMACEQGLSLTGPDGLLKQLTKTAIETSLNEEMSEHLSYEKYDPAGAGTGNVRNGTRSKTASMRWCSRCMHPGARAGTGGEGAKFWMAVLTDPKNRGVGHRDDRDCPQGIVLQGVNLRLGEPQATQQLPSR